MRQYWPSFTMRMGQSKPVSYLANKSIFDEIRKIKLLYCSFLDDHHAEYDEIITNDDLQPVDDILAALPHPVGTIVRLYTTVLTDNGVQFVQLQRGTKLTFPHIFGRVCLENGIEHRLTKPYHPWANGQAERMVRTIKEVTIKPFHYTSISEMRRHVRDWLTAYNFAKQLKALRFKTPYEAIEELWQSKPNLFIIKPNHHMLGLNT